LAVLTRAFHYYVAAGDNEQAVAIASYHLPTNLGKEIIETALGLVSPDSHDAGRLQCRYILPLRADYDKAQEAFQRALAVAQQQEDPALEMRTLVAGACVEFTSSNFERSLEWNLRAIRLAERVDQPYDECHANYDLMHVLYAMGDIEGAARHADALSEPAERSGIRLWQARIGEVQENVSSAKGNWESARIFSDQGLAILPQEPTLLGCRAALEYQVGNFAAGEDYLGRLLSALNHTNSERVPSYPGAFAPYYVVPAVVIPLAARITGVENHFELVEAIAQSVIDSPNADPGPVNVGRLGLALVAVHREDAKAADELYDRLAKIRGTMTPQCPMGPGLSGDRALGLLAQTKGNLTSAQSHFEDALTFCRKAGYRPELAWTCCDYADTLFQRNNSGDREKAMSLLDESLVISSELGMRPLRERVLSRRETLKA
jgi:tetratricopeptide (TPR) repeat protein